MHGMTFCIARMHLLIADFIDYVRIDPQINVDGMLENRKRSLAGFRMAGKNLAIVQPFSALLANPKFESIKTCVSVLPQPRSAHFLHWTDRHHELAELADEWTHCMPRPAPPEPGPAPSGRPSRPASPCIAPQRTLLPQLPGQQLPIQGMQVGTRMHRSRLHGQPCKKLQPLTLSLVFFQHASHFISEKRPCT